MKVAIEAKLKHGVLRRWREERGLSQREAAEQAGVCITSWGAVENLNFKHVGLKTLVKLAALVDVLPDELVPDELRGKQLGLRRIAYREVTGAQLLAHLPERFILPSPDVELEAQEEAASALCTLSERDMTLITHRYGLSGGEAETYEQLGERLGVSSCRVPQLEQRALRAMQNASECDILGCVRMSQRVGGLPITGPLTYKLYKCGRGHKFRARTNHWGLIYSCPVCSGAVIRCRCEEARPVDYAAAPDLDSDELNALWDARTLARSKEV